MYLYIIVTFEKLLKALFVVCVNLDTSLFWLPIFFNVYTMPRCTEMRI